MYSSVFYRGYGDGFNVHGEADLHGEGLGVDEVEVEHVELGREAGRVRVRPDREGTRSRRVP